MQKKTKREIMENEIIQIIDGLQDEEIAEILIYIYKHFHDSVIPADIQIKGI